jgi:hypothetical protein
VACPSSADFLAHAGFFEKGMKKFIDRFPV